MLRSKLQIAMSTLLEAGTLVAIFVVIDRASYLGLLYHSFKDAYHKKTNGQMVVCMGRYMENRQKG